MDFSVQSTSESHYIDGIYNHLSVHVCVDAYDIDKKLFSCNNKITHARFTLLFPLYCIIFIHKAMQRYSA